MRRDAKCGHARHSSSSLFSPIWQDTAPTLHFAPLLARRLAARWSRGGTRPETRVRSSLRLPFACAGHIWRRRFGSRQVTLRPTRDSVRASVKRASTRFGGPPRNEGNRRRRLIRPRPQDRALHTSIPGLLARAQPTSASCARRAKQSERQEPPRECRNSALNNFDYIMETSRSLRTISAPGLARLISRIVSFSGYPATGIRHPASPHTPAAPVVSADLCGASKMSSAPSLGPRPFLGVVLFHEAVVTANPEPRSRPRGCEAVHDLRDIVRAETAHLVTRLGRGCVSAVHR